MRNLFLIMCMLMFMLLLIGTAYADWIRSTVMTSPVFPEYAALIGLGATMVAAGVYGRHALSDSGSKETND